jgi:hypothetical protein
MEGSAGIGLKVGACGGIVGVKIGAAAYEIPLQPLAIRLKTATSVTMVRNLFVFIFSPFFECASWFGLVWFGLDGY